MCKSCQVLIGCSCYCKQEWKDSVQLEKENRSEIYCSRCNHSITN